jgi:acyl carrier protein
LPDLDFFVLFSSTGAFLPLPGGANYAAANAGLDALAQHRKMRGLPALSIAWCPWEDTGAVRGASGHARTAELERRGVLALSAERCSNLFIALRGCHSSTIAVFPADLGRLAQTHAERSLTRFRGLLADQAETAFEPSTQLSPTNQRGVLERLVRESVARVLKIQITRLDPRKPFGNMGLNSLLAMELRNRLEIALDRPLSATLAWNYPTIDILVDYLAGNSPRAQERRQVSRDLPQSLIDITALSDLEAMQLLLGQAADDK